MENLIISRSVCPSVSYDISNDQLQPRGCVTTTGSAGPWVSSAPWHPTCSSSGHIPERLGWEDLPGMAKCRILPGFGQDKSYKICVACWLPQKPPAPTTALPGTQLASPFCLPGSGAGAQALLVPPPGTGTGTWNPSGLGLPPPACIPGAGEELPWNSRGWLMCKVLETSAALCCHALNLFMKCSSLSAYVQRLGSHRLRSVQSEAKSLKINMGTSLENTATAPNFDCRPFPSPLDSEVMK